ncbi:prenyltransferase [Persicobacter sp. CCB-QB2]|uniref:prenyltransferase n=1 Tax=Persicobacter sp. CCB-QB2 TaxID=1561025 RepID=UPI0006A9B305|nr:prenyltransferase [Persicobacter sp. CCB-QB2]
MNYKQAKYLNSYTPWIKVLKINSWPKILVPFILGQLMGIHYSGQILWTPLLFGSIFAVSGVIFIVVVNDLGDFKVDKIKRQMFPEGCSPKTLPDNILSARQLKMAAALSMIIGFSAAFLAGKHIALGKEAFLMAIICCLTFVAYTLPPIKLNYRGGGEILEMLGVGALLPLFSAYLQAGTLAIPSARIILPVTLLLSLSSALASGLSDELSDIKGKKNTFTTLFGNQRVRQAIHWLWIMALAFWIISYFFSWHLPFIIHLIGAVIILWYGRKVLQLSPFAQTNQFKAINAFKQELHIGIWASMLIIGLLLLASP